MGITRSGATYVTHCVPRMGCSAEVDTPADGIALLPKWDSPQKVLKEDAGEKGCMRDPRLLQVFLQSGRCSDDLQATQFWQILEYVRFRVRAG